VNPIEHLLAMQRGDVASPPCYRPLGLSVEAAKAGQVIVRLSPSSDLNNPYGFVAGGVIVAALDTAAAWACETADRDGRAATTVELKTNFLRPVRCSDSYEAVATAVFSGTRTAVADVRLTGPDKQVHAIALVTCAMVTRKMEDFTA
jgi:uncharacterized protein (TIGR00369 family)